VVVLRRLDTLLEQSKDKALKELTFQQNDMGLTELYDKDSDTIGLHLKNIYKS